MYTSFSSGYCGNRRQDATTVCGLSFIVNVSVDNRRSRQSSDPVCIAEDQHGGAPGCSSSGRKARPNSGSPRTRQVVPGNDSGFPRVPFAASKQNEIHIVD